ncbi:hypothetical protein DDN26_14670 [Vibrio cholerae]|nr:hypothetical protein [Vibrio cholerae]
MIARWGLIVVMLFGFQQLFAFSGFDDTKLDSELGQLSSLLKPFVDPELIQSEIHSVGVFESVEYLETSILEPVSSKVSTSKGDFMVIGAVSGLKGQNVTITGLDDTRLKPKLCIETECFKLRNAPSL